MKKLIKSLQWAVSGIATTWKEEVNFRIELLFGFGVLMLAKYLNFTVIEWIIIVGCIGAVLGAEMLNTAVEDLCDRVESAHDPKIGKVKDVMGGFVLIVAITAATIGLMVFLNHI